MPGSHRIREQEAIETWESQCVVSQGGGDAGKGSIVAIRV